MKSFGMRRIRQLLLLLLVNGLVLGILILLSEGILGLLYNFPQTDLQVRAAREYYIYCDRKTVTYENGQGRYDSLVSYTFNPGEFPFSNKEYNTDYQINALGFRDDECSVSNPRLALLGDSHSAGWGVNQDELFAQLVEDGTGLRLLNTAIPSFALPRELLLLDRFNTDSLDAILIQYCDNDRDENAAFREYGDRAHVMTGDEYESNRTVYQRMTRHYQPGRYLRIFFPMLVRQIAHQKASSAIPHNLLGTREPVEEAVNFLHVLESSPVPLADKPVVVFEIVSYNSNSDAFVNAVDSLMATPAYIANKALPRITTVHLAELLKEEHYYVYDDHMNASGHKVVAEALLRHLKRTGLAMQATAEAKH